jgi:simple sugar transport system ATP-binding protein
MADKTVFEIRGLRKSFGTVRVLDGVDLSIAAGKVTVLMGANGAGKSTLVRIISGVYSADAGDILLEGNPFQPGTPAEALRAGVVTVHQNINDGVVADLDVATNLTLDRLNGSGAPLIFNRSRVRREARVAADRMGLALDMRANVGDLSLADRQMVAIARAMMHEPRLLILDEPTSSLSSVEADRLFGFIDSLRERGVAVLYISHRMSDIRRLADSVVALRDGRIAGVFEGPEIDYEGAVDAMLGRSSNQSRVDVQKAGKAVFEASGLQLASQSKPFSLSLGAGEVVAVTGLVGVGKSALAEVLFGLKAPVAGSMRLDGRDYRPTAPREAISAGVFMIAKDRAINGIVPDFPIYRNMSLPFLKRFSRLSIMSRGREEANARRQIEELGVVCRSEQDDLATLSGGNQQKVMVGRWLAFPARLLILDEPFQGVDIAARRDIGRKLRQSAGDRATLVFLTELDEAFEVADRILVMSEHTIVGEHVNDDPDVDQLLAEIAGRHPPADAHSTESI